MESPYCSPNRDFSIMWHPAITSTPLVPIFKRNPGFKSSQMQLIKPADVAKAYLENKIIGSLISLKEKKKNTNSKKATKKRNKKSAYFEVSSSDDEDCFVKSTLPSVKITLGKSTNHRIISDNKPDKKTPQEENMGNNSNNFLKNDCESKDCPIENKVRTGKINGNSVKKCIKKKITDRTTEILVQQNVSNKQIHNNFIIKNKKKLESSNAKENMAVLNNRKINDKIHTVKNKNSSKASESLKTNNVLDNKLLNDKIKIPVSTESDKNSILKEKNEEIKFPKSFQNLKTQTSKIPIQVSKKIKENGLNPAKTGKRKLCINKASSSSCIQSKKKKNLSHQLFSDTKEQELIDSLDLTVVEPDEKICASSLDFNTNQSEACSAKPQTGQTSSSPKTKPDNSEYDKRKILRQRKSPKKYWLPKDAVESEKITDQKSQNNMKKKNTSSDSLKNKKSKKNLAQDKLELENQEAKAITEISQKNSKSNNINGEIINNSTVKTGQDQKELVEIEVITENMVVKQKRTRKRKSLDVMKSTTSKIMRLTDKKEEKKGDNSIVSDKKLKNDFLRTNAPESTSSGVFQKLGEASFIENKPGCFASEFQVLNGFKCGILKVCGNSEISCKTAHKYSYFGGVLIKNKLKMTIGMNKIELEEGDMAFVPPLTEWSAVNETESESTFYYWCCKLKC